MAEFGNLTFDVHFRLTLSLEVKCCLHVISVRG